MGCPVWRSLGIILGIVLVIIGVVCGLWLFPYIINNKVDDNLKLVNGSDAYERWVNTPIPILFKVYFFNITNPEKVRSGGTPDVKEVGPYVYSKIRNKSDIFQENDTLSYYQGELFFFNKEASGDNDEDDIITIPNLMLMSLLQLVEKKGRKEIITVNRFLNDLLEEHNNLFMTTTPRDFLFNGITIHCNKKVPLQNTFNEVCKQIREEKTDVLEKLEDGRIKFSLLSFKNKTHEKRYKINSGIEKINLLGEIIEYGNLSKLDTWEKNSTCNDLYGSDTTIYPPHQIKKSTINVFEKDICRVINLDYKDESEYKDVLSYRFIADNDQLASGKSVADNQCFCINKTKGITGSDGCLLDGAMELFSCINAPVVLTFPHFLGAHKKYQKGVTGVKPDEILHKTFIELEPTSGILLRGSKRVQFNIFYRQIEGIKMTYELNETLMPVIWIDEGIDLNDENINLLKDTMSAIKTLDIIKWSLIGIGAVIALIIVISLCVV